MNLTTVNNNIIVLQIEDNPNLIAGFSTRNFGYSIGNFWGLNLGINTDDNYKNVLKNRKTFFSSIAPKMNVALGLQTHSSNINEVNERNLFFTNTDGLYTKCKNILLTTTVADCGVILFYNSKNNFVASLHCGWKGLKNGILENAVSIMKKHDKIQNFHAIIGPMIQYKNYEVGKEFIDVFDSKYLIPQKGKYLFDLNKNIEDILADSGLLNIYNTKIDTFTNSNEFYSFRKNNQTGRFCGYIGLK